MTAGFTMQQQRYESRGETQLDSRGRCCGRKPLIYRRKHARFCTRCCAEFDLNTGKQQTNWAWQPCEGGFIRQRAGVSVQTISKDLRNLSTVDKSKPAKMASNPKGTGRPKGSDSQQVVKPEQTKHRPIPNAGYFRTTIEAIVYCVQQRGLAALKEPTNKERLARCDDAASAEIKRRIAKLRDHVMASNKSSREQS